MTWTKLGEEFSDEARDLTDAEFRTHVEALGWSNRRGLDLRIPKREVRKFTESPDAAEAVDGLAAKGWWIDEGECWNIGAHFPDWQLERAVIEKRREATALRMRRMRLHKADDHSLCLSASCPFAAADVTRNETRHEMRNPVRFGSVPSEPPEPPFNQDQNQDQDQIRRAGDGVDGNPSPLQGAGQDQERSEPNSQNRRVRHGSESMADDAQESRFGHSESGTTQVHTRASTPQARKPAA
jgi:hypothetical protein